MPTKTVSAGTAYRFMQAMGQVKTFANVDRGVRRFTFEMDLC